jgi:RNA polymerase sigma-70 factor, ECF subfamily
VDDAERYVLADAVAAVLLTRIEPLTASERLAFALREVLGLPFADIADALGCSPAAARALVERARRQVRGNGRGG